MTDAELDDLAMLLCAAIDDGEPCDSGVPCETCKRMAQEAAKFLARQTKH